MNQTMYNETSYEVPVIRMISKLATVCKITYVLKGSTF